ncbi:MAG TPA: carboxypeptidase-like regulatory domain-containing protein [Chitinophagales bacterium]|nr:carboxypeptidase-like regulatory domain-containing protein [Chitinophagales bacterium]
MFKALIVCQCKNHYLVEKSGFMHRAMKVLLLMPVFLWASTAAKAVSTGDVLGQIVVAETHQPLSYAQVVFENGMDKITITADTNGNYYASHLPTGRYQMRVVFNSRTFVMNKIRVYDSYTSEVNFKVSTNTGLPTIVQLEKDDKVIDVLNPNNIVLAGNCENRQTKQLGEILMQQPGVDVRNGRLYIKGSANVKFFVDGSPVMEPPVLEGGW